MKLFLAGMEQLYSYECMKQGGIDYGFYSYYYMRNERKVNKSINIAQKMNKCAIIDSGAHSFFSEMAGEGVTSASVYKKKSKTKESHEEYFQKYIVWLKKYWDDFNYYVELDIGDVVGQETVFKWRERLKAEGLFSKCIIVWHPNVMDWDDYLFMLEETESRYIAIEGDRTNRPRLIYNQYIKEAYDRQIKIHCFAMTKLRALHKYPFYSVDSSSWTIPVRWGHMPVFQKGRLISVRATKENYLQYKINTAFRPNNVNKENSILKLRLSAEAYVKMGEYLTALWEKRGIVWKN